MAGPASKVERPIYKRIPLLSFRGRVSALAATVLVLANAVGLAAYFSRQPGETPSKTDRATTATPSWRIEAQGAADPTRRPAGPGTEAPGAAPVDPAEIVTPELLRAANRSPCSPSPDSWIDVLQHGAKGNGRADDTEAIQKANDAVARNGGGRVLFPAGVYRTYNVVQDSCVEFAGEEGATLIHPDGTSPGHVVKSRVRSTTGSIQRRSRVLKVESTQGIVPGSLVAVQAAGGKSRIQRTTLSVAAPPRVNTISVRDTKGFKSKYTNYLFLGDEIISYDGIRGNSLSNVRRGLFGTASVHHQPGTIVAQAQRMYAVVVRVTGKRVVLDGLSWSSIQNAQVDIGSVGTSVVGLTIDGNRQAGGSWETNPFPLKYALARWVTIRGATLRNGDHGGVSFDTGTRDSVIEGNVFVNHGDPGNKLGSAIWLYRGATRNIVRDNTITGRTFVGVTLDDRSVESTEYDADTTNNTIVGNEIDIPFFPITRSAGVFVTGVSRNTIVGNVIRNARTGIMVHQDWQGTAISQAILNRVHDNTVVANHVGLVVTGSDNEFVQNVIRNAETPWKNSGQRNLFVDNTVEP